MISLVTSSAKTSDFASPKELKDQLPITWDLLQSFVQKVFLFFSHEMENAYASSRTRMRHPFTTSSVEISKMSENIQREYP